MYTYAVVVLVLNSLGLVYEMNKKNTINLVYLLPVPFIGRILGWW